MKGDTQFTCTKHIFSYLCKESYISYYMPVPLTISSNQKKSTVKKQLYPGKVPSFLTFVAIKRQYFELLAQEIKCRLSTTDLCAQMYANMLTSTCCSGLIGQFAQ